MDEQNEKFPKEVLNQIIENSGGGLVLFIINEDGKIEVHPHYDHETGQKAILRKVQDWAFAQSKLSSMEELDEYLIEFDDDDTEGTDDENYE